MGRWAFLRHAGNVVVGDALSKIQPQQEHDGLGDICTKLETTAARLRDPKARPKNLLTLFDSSTISLNKRVIDFQFPPNNKTLRVGSVRASVDHGHLFSPRCVLGTRIIPSVGSYLCLSCLTVTHRKCSAYGLCASGRPNPDGERDERKTHDRCTTS